MKINWGAGIAMLYTGFVAMILLLVGMSLSQKIDLVTEHYYEEELGFQEKIDKTKRSAALAEPIKWEVTDAGITIIYPDKKQVTGKINLYCPSNDKNDRHFLISSKNDRQFIKSTDIPAGTYKLQIDWKSGGE